jgi:hypothetical protein
MSGDYRTPAGQPVSIRPQPEPLPPFHPQRMGIATPERQSFWWCWGRWPWPPTAQARAGSRPDTAGHAGRHTRRPRLTRPCPLRSSPGSLEALRRVGSSGAFVMDAATDRVLFARKAGRPRILASNSKIFTTSTALGRFGPAGHLLTTALSSDPITDNVSQGLYLRGEATRHSPRPASTSRRPRACGRRTTVQGPLL